MSRAFERVQLTSAAAATAGSTRWDGGPVTFVVRGTWGGATAALQYSPDGGTSWVDIAPTISTADSVVNCLVPQGHVQLRITGGSSPALSSYLVELPTSSPGSITLSQTLNNTQSVGASGTAGELDIYPTTASKGKTALTAADNSGNTTTTITTAAQAAARTYTVPDAGADASFVMTAGNQTITGTKTMANVTVSAGGKIVPDNGQASATAGAATLNKAAGVITTESLTTAAAASYTLTLTNSLVDGVNAVCFAAIRSDGTNSAGTPRIVSITPTAGTLTIVVNNQHASAAFNGTLKIAYYVLPSA